MKLAVYGIVVIVVPFFFYRLINVTPCYVKYSSLYIKLNGSKSFFVPTYKPILFTLYKFCKMTYIARLAPIVLDSAPYPTSLPCTTPLPHIYRLV